MPQNSIIWIVHLTSFIIIQLNVIVIGNTKTSVTKPCYKLIKSKHRTMNLPSRCVKSYYHLFILLLFKMEQEKLFSSMMYLYPWIYFRYLVCKRGSGCIRRIILNNISILMQVKKCWIENVRPNFLHIILNITLLFINVFIW